MNWTNAADLLFPAGALLAAGLVAYGWCLFITAPQAHPRKDNASSSPATSADY